MPDDAEEEGSTSWFDIMKLSLNPKRIEIRNGSFHLDAKLYVPPSRLSIFKQFYEDAMTLTLSALPRHDDVSARL